MSDTSTWLLKYEELIKFLNKNQEIIINKNICFIPKNIRSEFYQLFDDIRRNFILDVYPDYVGYSKTLVSHYKTAEEIVVKNLNLTEISYSSKTGRFLNAPLTELEKVLFHTLFDLLKGKIDRNCFQNRASMQIESSFKQLFRSGYEKWVLLVIMDCLKADNIYQVDIKEITTSDLYKLGAIRAEEAAAPYSSNKIRFTEDSHEKVFLVPDVIFHSALLNKYVAYKTNIDRPLMTASNLNKNREWLPIFDTLNRKLEIALIYCVDNPNDISVIADAKYICRPDMAIDCKVERYWTETKALENSVQNLTLLQPYAGYLLVSKDSAVIENSDGAGNKIDYLSDVGFDKNKIRQICNKL